MVNHVHEAVDNDVDEEHYEDCGRLAHVAPAKTTHRGVVYETKGLENNYKDLEYIIKKSYAKLQLIIYI